jgi:hypothetical protein
MLNLDIKFNLFPLFIEKKKKLFIYLFFILRVGFNKLFGFCTEKKYI